MSDGINCVEEVWTLEDEEKDVLQHLLESTQYFLTPSGKRGDENKTGTEHRKPQELI